MDLKRIVTELVETSPRGSCTDAERRAARLLSRALKEGGRKPRTQPVWVRPQWPWIWLLHTVLGIAGSIASVESPIVGLSILAVATLSALAQLHGRFELLALLWPRRATQNVVAREAREAPVRLILTAAYDAPALMTGLLRSGHLADAGMRRLLRGRWPHPLALLVLALAALTGCAIARVAGVEDSQALGAVQLLPTVACIVAVALLTDVALGRTSPGASANASAAAAVLAIAETLDRRPPRNLAVDVVLTGASDGPWLGMREFVRRERRRLRPEEVAVLHVEPCGEGETRVWSHDGPLLALALHPRLVSLASELAPTHRGHGGGAYPARQARWPAVALGGLDERGIAPLARSGEDDLEHVDLAAIRRTVDIALQLVARLDADLAGRSS